MFGQDGRRVIAGGQNKEPIMPVVARRAGALFLSLIMLLPGIATADTDARLAQARTMFEKFVALSHRYDPSVTAFYRDDARIVAYRTYPFGKERRMTMRGDQYKDAIRALLPLARMRGDRSEFSDITYSAEGSGVRIRATRHSLLKNYQAPHSLLVAPDGSGAWRIVEEITRTRP